MADESSSGAETQKVGKCPSFRPSREDGPAEYKEWKKKVTIWLRKFGSIDKTPGTTIYTSIKGEAWRLVQDIEIDDLEEKDGHLHIFKILDRKYALDREVEQREREY